MRRSNKYHARCVSDLEETLWRHIRAYELPMIREVRFHPKRAWRFDFGDPIHKIAAECEGGVWNSGRHSRGAGMLADMDKYNEATRLGWQVYRFGRLHIMSGKAVRLLADAIRGIDG